MAVKDFAAGKSRLGAVLEASRRERLSRQLYSRTLSVITASGLFDGTLVVSDDSDALELAGGFGAVALPEPGGGLNRALEAGREAVVERGATSVLLVHADLPLLEPDDFEALFAALPSKGAALVLAPDRHGGGTNALLERPPGAMALRFGANSFRLHREAAQGLGLRLAVVESVGLGLDLDVPGDLEALPAGLLDSLVGSVVSLP
jgi:2-phospho-L-lactate guanylyltransferase